MNLDIPQNELVLRYQTRSPRNAPPWAAHDAVFNPYEHCGCHPDIVERIWDQIGKALPADCRCLIYGVPALAHPVSSLILALGMGTRYGLRVPPASMADTLEQGATTTASWSTGITTDISVDLGGDWVFGAWLAGEIEWCKQVYGKSWVAA